MARLFNAARREKSKSRFTNLGLENYKKGKIIGYGLARRRKLYDFRQRFEDVVIFLIGEVVE